MSDVSAIKEILAAVSEMVDVIEKVTADGKVTLLDLRHVPELMASLKPLLEKSAEAKDEVAHLDADGAKEIADLGIDLAMKLLAKLS